MSELVTWLKDIYTKVKTKTFEWKNVYPNNMLVNGIEGVYTDMFFERDNKYTYVKYTIDYCSRCDEEGVSHPEEGTRYYVLHELRMHDVEEKFEIPKPTKELDWEDEYSLMVNNYGRFRYVFDDEETAKSVVAHDLLMMIYPYTYILKDEEMEEWHAFLEEQEGLE